MEWWFSGFAGHKRYRWSSAFQVLLSCPLKALDALVQLGPQKSAFLASSPDDFHARVTPWKILVVRTELVHLIILCPWIGLKTDLES